MCGLTGFITTNNNKWGSKGREEYLTQTLIVDSLRGFHATGIFYGLEKEGKGSVGYAKACVQGAEFVRSVDYLNAVKSIDQYRFCVGHNRWATVGNTDDVENAHPFVEGPIHLVHNGTLRGDGGLKTTQASLKVDVDSHALCHNLALHDAAEVLQNVNGAYTVIWHDKRDGTLNFARNSERPLWMFSFQSSDTIFFGSERKMMEWILDRNNIGKVNGKFEMLPVGKIWKFAEKATKPVIIDIPYKYVAPPVYRRGSVKGKAAANTAQSRTTSYTGAKNTSVDGNKSTSPSHGLVPDSANTAMNDYGYDRTDRLPYIAHARTGNMSVGIIDGLGTPAFVIGVSSADHFANFDKRWCVRPIAIRMVTQKSGYEEEVAVCVASQLYYYDSMYKYGKAFQKEKEVAPVKKTPEPSVMAPARHAALITGDQSNLPMTVPVYHGPQGQKVVSRQWYAATSTGCGVCRDIPSLSTSEDLTWLNDGRDTFLCKKCSDLKLGVNLATGTFMA